MVWAMFNVTRPVGAVGARRSCVAARGAIRRDFNMIALDTSSRRRSKPVDIAAVLPEWVALDRLAEPRACRYGRSDHRPDLSVVSRPLQPRAAERDEGLRWTRSAGPQHQTVGQRRRAAASTIGQRMRRPCRADAQSRTKPALPSWSHPAGLVWPRPRRHCCIA